MAPTILYKYTTNSTAEIVLKSGKLRWSSPSVFNDVAEFQRMPVFSPTIEDSYRLLQEAIVDCALGSKSLDEDRLGRSPKFYLSQIRALVKIGFTKSDLLSLPTVAGTGADAAVEKALRAAFLSFEPNQARIMCLTSRSENEVMWGTYAENHTGCVLGFRHIPSLSTPFTEAKQVTYSESPPVVASGLDFLLYGDTPELRAKTMHAVCFSKKLAWSYEEEWRALTWRREEVGVTHGDYKFYPQELESVTFGARATTERIEILSALIQEQYPSAVVYQMKAVNDQFTRVSIDR